MNLRSETTLIPVLFGILLGSAACGSHKAPPTEQQPAAEPAKAEPGTVKLAPEQIRAAEIRVETVQRRPLRDEIEVLGQIASDTDRLVHVRADEAGTVQEVSVSVGDEVEPGQTLLRHQPEGSAAEVREVKASVRGIVVGRYAEPGSHVDPSVPLLTIADTSLLRCGLDVYEKDAIHVRKGQRVRIKASVFPDRVFDSQITYVSPRVDETSRTIKVRTNVENPRGDLKFGSFVKGYIQTGSREVLAVPEAAVQRINGKSAVFVTEIEGEFASREVQAGDTKNGFVEIKSGLREGEHVVTQGGFILKSELEKGSLGGE